MTSERTEDLRKAEQILKDMDLGRDDTQTRQVKAAEAQAWATLAIAEAVTLAAESVNRELKQILKVFPKAIAAK